MRDAGADISRNFATAAVDGLHARHPKRSAREKLALWQRLSIYFIPLAFACWRLLSRQSAIARAFFRSTGHIIEHGVSHFSKYG